MATVALVLGAIGGFVFLIAAVEIAIDAIKSRNVHYA